MGKSPEGNSLEQPPLRETNQYIRTGDRHDLLEALQRGEGVKYLSDELGQVSLTFHSDKTVDVDDHGDRYVYTIGTDSPETRYDHFIEQVYKELTGKIG